VVALHQGWHDFIPGNEFGDCAFLLLIVKIVEIREESATHAALILALQVHES
jgi:hypothetical protein